MARRGDGAAVGAVGWSVTDGEGTDEVCAAGSVEMREVTGGWRRCLGRKQRGLRRVRSKMRGAAAEGVMA